MSTAACQILNIPLKKLLVIPFLYTTLFVSAANYYVRDGGNDMANGRSDGSAWATTDKVNSMRFGPGDTIFFKCGGTWRITKSTSSLRCGSGTTRGRVVYTSYGTGSKPLILGSEEENNTSDWLQIRGNLWRNSDPLFTTQVGNIIFNGGNSCGIRTTSPDSLDSQGEFFYDPVKKSVILYSAGNPAAYYTDIEVALTIEPALIHARNRRFVTIDGFDLRYGARHGIFISGSDNITVKNCNVSFFGGTLPRSTRLGNAIEMWGSVADIIIEKNYISQSYDSGVTSQYMSDSVVVSDITIRNNIFYRNDFHFEWWYMNCTGTISNLYFENNTCIEAGRGWSHSQKTANLHNEDIYISFLHQVKTRNLFIRNNIFSKARNYAVRGATNPASLLFSLIEWDNNIYDNDMAINIGLTGARYTLAQWQAYSGADLHSSDDDPLFVSPVDFHLRKSSPAINAGFDTGLEDDFDGVKRDRSVDIGAYEYAE